MSESSSIDFVIPWVDGTDEAWLARKDAFSGEDRACDSPSFRFRDWNLLKYWFRTVEVNAPWVRTVHLVTCGQVPDWINLDCPKLDLVDHTDYIPEEYLPTFSSRPIELNFHRIPGLSEQFVFFNDDMFVGSTVSSEEFFRGGLPVDLAALNVFCYSEEDPTQLCVVRDAGVINKHFCFRDSVRSNFGAWMSPKAGHYLPRTLSLLACPRFPGFVIHHCAQPFLKATFEEVWAAEPDLLHRTSCNRFRDTRDVNCWLMKEWQLASGAFVPNAARKYRCLFVDSVESAETAAEVIRKQSIPHICINDSRHLSEEEFPKAAAIVRQAFEAAYGMPSQFEKSG